MSAFEHAPNTFFSLSRLPFHGIYKHDWLMKFSAPCLSSIIWDDGMFFVVCGLVFTVGAGDSVPGWLAGCLVAGILVWHRGLLDCVMDSSRGRSRSLVPALRYGWTSTPRCARHFFLTVWG
ncbi:hypothetical protein CC2G_000340 [Coprinopsis cinerea AmutBmut pab1-1]|nr:hypothetical protein CC2G_000340 [Coprinopsis cinerea AmutBmut pab1-1]